MIRTRNVYFLIATLAKKTIRLQTVHYLHYLQHYAQLTLITLYYSKYSINLRCLQYNPYTTFYSFASSMSCDKVLNKYIFCVTYLYFILLKSMPKFVEVVIFLTLEKWNSDLMWLPYCSSPESVNTYHWTDLTLTCQLCRNQSEGKSNQGVVLIHLASD